MTRAFLEAEVLDLAHFLELQRAVDDLVEREVARDRAARGADQVAGTLHEEEVEVVARRRRVQLRVLGAQVLVRGQRQQRTLACSPPNGGGCPPLWGGLSRAPEAAASFRAAQALLWGA